MKEMIHTNIYYCESCHYTFAAGNLPNRCTDCGKEYHNGSPAVRPATEEEITEYLRIKAEIAQESIYSGRRTRMITQSQYDEITRYKELIENCSSNKEAQSYLENEYAGRG